MVEFSGQSPEGEITFTIKFSDKFVAWFRDTLLSLMRDDVPEAEKIDLLEDFMRGIGEGMPSTAKVLSVMTLWIFQQGPACNTYMRLFTSELNQTFHTFLKVRDDANQQMQSIINSIPDKHIN